MSRSDGHCMTMGSASTMASMAEALGMQLPYSATWPAVDARRYETAQRAGQVIVRLVRQEPQSLRPSAIKTMADPFQPAGTGTAVLRGNLAPDGAVIKQSASSPHLLKHRGRALVFDSPADYYAVSNDPELDVDEDTVLVIRYCGPVGYPGMPEVSNVAQPRKLLLRGVRDMVRICDGRMSGTAYGTVVLHVAPEAAAGGPLALVRNGDWITLDVPARTLTLEVSAEELAARRARWQPPAPHASRGWTRLYCERVMQADSGADLDFLVGASGHEVPRESH